MDVIILRLEAPLMSFGGVQVDDRSPTEQFPAQSMIAGMIANALGYTHRNYQKTQRLQERLRVAARRDRAGREVVDFQIANLGDIGDIAWTTDGIAEKRGRTDNVIRYRHYLADAVYTLALALAHTDETPTLADIESALKTPARPLYIGRKCCVPASPLLRERMNVVSLRSALEAYERSERSDHGPLAAWWPDEDAPADSDARSFRVTDMRDWANQIHSGRRRLHHGLLDGSTKS